jgi:hypothetical protein
MRQDQQSEAHQPGPTKMGQQVTSQKHSHDNPKSKSGQEARYLKIFENSAPGQTTNRRRRATSSYNQDGTVDALDKDQESLEKTRAHKGQIIAGKGEILSELKDEGEAPHQERADMCNHDELALEQLEPQISYASSSARYSSTHVARDNPQDQSRSSNRHFHELMGQTREPSSSRRGSMRGPNQEVPDVAALLKSLEEKDRALEKYSKKYNMLKEERREAQQQMNLVIQNREAELRRKIKQLIHEREHREERFQREVAELIVDRDSAREEYEDLIRKQQEESFKQMSTARWLPADDNTVMIEFGRIKTAMRSWARKNSIKSMSPIENLEGSEYRSFLTALSNVAVFENEELPRGLQTPKSPGLILNAILAHHLCTNMFGNPFFFLEHLPGVELLHRIYGVAQSGETKSFHRRTIAS